MSVQEIGPSLPLHINSSTSVVDELCYIQLDETVLGKVYERKYIVTQLASTYILMTRVGYKQQYLIINTLLGDTFMFVHLFHDRNIPLKNVDFSLNRVVTYDAILDTIHQYYHQIVY